MHWVLFDNVNYYGLAIPVHVNWNGIIKEVGVDGGTQVIENPGAEDQNDPCAEGLELEASV